MKPFNHHTNVLATAANMRMQLQDACCANHAAEIALITAFSFAEDVSKGDARVRSQFIAELTKHIEKALAADQIRFARMPSGRA